MNRDAATADLASVRDTLRSSKDRRVAATRARIYEAVRALAADGADISATTVASSAGISRATFYTHFAGLDDLALHLQEDAFAEIASRTTAADESAMLASQHALIAHYAGLRSLYAGVFAIAMPRGAESRVAELMKEQILAHIRSFTAPPAGIDPAIAAAYIAHAAVGVLASWVLGEIEATEDELAEHLTQLMPRWMHTRIPASAGDPDGAPSSGKKNRK